MASSSSSSVNSTSTVGNVIRITGLATGLDVDATVKKLMTAEQLKIDKAKQSQQKVQWQQDAYKDIIKDVQSLQSSFFDVNSADSCMISSTSYSALDVTSTNTAIGTMTAGVGAQVGNYTLQVVQTAAGANYTNKITSNNGSVSLTSKLSTIGATGAMSGKLALSLNINGGVANATNGGKAVNITLDNTGGTSTVNDLLNAINTQGGGLVNASYSELTQKFTLTTVATGNNVSMAIDSSSSTGLSQMINPTAAAYTNSITSNDGTTITGSSKLSEMGTAINMKVAALNLNLDLGGGQTVNVSLDNSGDNKTMNDLISQINTAGVGKVSASFNPLTNNISFQNLLNNQSVSIGSGTTAEMYNVITSVTSGKQGNNADVFITPPGQSTAVEVKNQTSNGFTIDGMSYNISTTGTTTLGVVQDTQKVYDKFTNFLTKYNALMDKINTKLTDKKDPNYPPLTDDQKASMTTDQIANWNAKAQTGVLRNDSKLQQLFSDLKGAFADPISGVSLQIGKYGSNSFGLDISSDMANPGEVHIVDPLSFRNAIEENPSQFLNFFTKVSASTNSTTNYNESGVFQRIQKSLNSNVGIVNTISTSAILTQYASYQDSFSNFGGTGLNTLMDQLYQKNLAITNLNTEYSTMQTSYYNKFSALETAMSKLNAQSSTLSGIGA